MRVLLVEDESRVAANIAAALREGPGYAVDIAPDGVRGADLACEGSYDLIILDLMVPKLNGLEVLKLIRQERQSAPVLVLTARSEKQSVVALLNAGADDYMAKPFDLGELLARAKALVRRGKGLTNPKVVIGDLQVDTIEKYVELQGLRIEVSPTEYRILEYLVHHPRSIVSKQALLEHLYDYNWERHSNVIEAHISNLRRKLSSPHTESCIETLRGRGYRLTLPSPRTHAAALPIDLASDPPNHETKSQS
jgi:two-component system response regulator PhoP